MNPIIEEALVALLILIGAVFLLVGAIGLAKLPTDAPLHGPTKASTLGIGALLVASMVHFAALSGTPSIHELLITLLSCFSPPR